MRLRMLMLQKCCCCFASRLTVLCAIVGAMGCESEPAGESPPTAPTANPPATHAADAPEPNVVDPQVDSFPTFGFALRRPAGWELEPAISPAGVVGRWLPAGAGDDDWSQFSVDVQTLVDENIPLGAIAEDTMRRLPNQKANYRIDVTTVDGSRALEVLPQKTGVQNDDEPPILGPVVLVARGPLLYKFTFLLDDPRELKLARQVIREVRWQKVMPLFEACEFGQDVTLFDGKCQVTLPQQARLDLAMTTDRAQAFIVFDYVGKQDGLSMVFELVESADNTAARQAVNYAEMIEGRTQLNGFLDFRPRDDNSRVWNSAYLEGNFPDGSGGTVTRHSRFAVWQVGRNEFVHAQFVVNDEVVTTNAQTEQVMQTIDEVLASCKVGE